MFDKAYDYDIESIEPIFDDEAIDAELGYPEEHEYYEE